MRNTPDFEETCALMRDLGFTLEEVQFQRQAFGSWFVSARAKGKPIRVVWDGRDYLLFIQKPCSSARLDPWKDFWTAGDWCDHKLAELQVELIGVLNS